MSHCPLNSPSADWRGVRVTRGLSNNPLYFPPKRKEKKRSADLCGISLGFLLRSFDGLQSTQVRAHSKWLAPPPRLNRRVGLNKGTSKADRLWPLRRRQYPGDKAPDLEHLRRASLECRLHDDHYYSQEVLHHRQFCTLVAFRAWRLAATPFG